MNTVTKALFDNFMTLGEADKIIFLTAVAKAEPFKFEYAQMTPSEKLFHNPNAVRPK